MNNAHHAIPSIAQSPGAHDDFEQDERGAPAPAAPLAILPTHKITQDFVSEVPLSNYSCLRPHVAQDGSLHVFCLDENDFPTQFSRGTSNPNGWVKTQLAAQACYGIEVHGEQTKSPCVSYSVPAFGYEGSPCYNPFVATLNEQGGTGVFQAFPRDTWMLGQPPSYENGACVMLSPYLDMLVMVNGNPSYPSLIALPPGEQGVIVCQNGPAVKSDNKAIVMLPYPQNAAFNMLYWNTNGGLSQAVATGSPDDWGSGNEVWQSVPQPPKLPPNTNNVARKWGAIVVEDVWVMVVALACGVDGGTAPGWFTLAGQLDATQPGNVRWDPSWDFVSHWDSAGNPLSFNDLSVVWSKDNYCTMMLTDISNQLVISTKGIDGFAQWTLPTAILADVNEAAVFLDDGDELRFVTMNGGANGASGVNLALRTASGNWTHEHVSVAPEVAVAPSITTESVYRAGFLATDANNQGVSGICVSIEASINTMATIGGLRYYIGPGRTINAETDGTGAVWVTMKVNPTGLQAPSLTFRSASFAGGEVVVLPDADVQAHLHTVTADQLINGTGTDGLPVLPVDKQSGAADMAQTLNSIGGLCAALYQQESARIPGLTLRPSMKTSEKGFAAAQLRWATDVGARQPLVAPAVGGPSWEFSVASGKPTFRHLTATDIERFKTLPCARNTQEVRDLFGIDWGDVWDSVSRGLSSVVSVAVHVATAVVTLVINGVTMVISTILEAAAAAFSLVIGVFNAVGTMLGTVVGWLIKEIGFLFGWGDILKRRDQYKSLVMDTAQGLPAKLPYTSNFIGGIQSFLTDFKKDVNGYAGMVSGEDNKSFGGSLSTSSISDALGEVMSPVSWVLEKLQSAMSVSLGGLSALSIPALAAPLQDLEKAGEGVALPALVGSMMSGVAGTLLSGGAALASGQPSQLLAPFVDAADSLIDVAAGALGALDESAKALWTPSSMTGLFEYLDQSVDLGFLSGFYKGLTENDLSMLDAICLIAAIFGEDARFALPENASRGEVTKTLVETMLFVGIGTRMISSAFAVLADAPKTAATFFDGLDAALALVVSILMLELADVMDPWFIAAVLYMLFTALTLASKCIKQEGLAVGCAGITALTSVPVIIYMFVSHQDLMASLYTTFDAVAIMLSVALAMMSEEGEKLPGYPYSAIAYAAVQTSLATVCAVTYKESSDESRARSARLLAAD